MKKQPKKTDDKIELLEARLTRAMAKCRAAWETQDRAAQDRAWDTYTQCQVALGDAVRAQSKIAKPLPRVTVEIPIGDGPVSVVTGKIRLNGKGYSVIGSATLLGNAGPGANDLDAEISSSIKLFLAAFRAQAKGRK